MTADRLRVHVLFEHGTDHQPFGSAWLRLLLPLDHPSTWSRIEARFALDYDGRPADVVLVDRLWRPDLDRSAVEGLARRTTAAGARLLVAIDDNFADLALEHPDWADSERWAAFELLVASADGLVVTTDALAQRYATQSARIEVVPNALDERLLERGWRRSATERLAEARSVADGTNRPVTIGYMGTYTHASDLRLVAPALEAVARRHGEGIRIQLLGVASEADAAELLAGIPHELVHPDHRQALYPLFLPWFLRRFRWDIALAPLRDTPFNAAKSDVKFLDYAALGAAGVFSRHPAYAATVRHGVTGWLAGDDPAEWEAAIERWIEAPQERRQVAGAAREYVTSERTLERSGHRLAEALEHLAAAAPPRRTRRPARRTPRVHVLYEYGSDARPHASSVLRLLRPLDHPAAREAVEASFGMELPNGAVDAVIVDRLWRPDVSLERAQRLVARVRAAGSRLLYALDDNLLDLRAERGDWPTPEHEQILELWLRQADGVIVTTPALRERVAALNRFVEVVPNVLDERLLVRRRTELRDTPFGARPVVIGYMGSATHAADLRLVLPALRRLVAARPGDVALELVGVADGDALADDLAGLPVRIVAPKAPEREYGPFLVWFTATARWDIAISPMVETPFTRCKSDVKYLDYAAICAAPVVSRHPAYSATVVEGQTGMACGDGDSWLTALLALVDDDELRGRLALGASEYLRRERVLAVRAGALPAAVVSILDSTTG